MSEPDIVQRIQAHIASFQRSKVRLGAPKPVVAAAARVGDPIKHKSFLGALAGAAAGALIEGAVIGGCAFAFGGFGGLAVGMVLLNMPAVDSFINNVKSKVESFFESDAPDGFIIKGSSNVFVNGKPLAFTALENQDFTVQCNNHDKQRIAMGSETVFVNGNPVARKGDKTTCDAVISDGSPNVFFGSGQGFYAEITPEFSKTQQVLLVATEFLVPPTTLFRKGIANGIKMAGKSVALRGSHVGSIITNKAKDLYKRSTLKLKNRKDITKTFEPNLATNKQKANFGEIKSSQNMLITRHNIGSPPKNYNLERIGKPAPTSLDDTIRKGIDGIYKNKTPPPKFVIDEAKYGKSKLGVLKDGTAQMSDTWIMGGGRLSHLEPKVRKELMEAIQDNEIERVLSKVDEKGNVKTFMLNEKGKIIGLWP